MISDKRSPVGFRNCTGKRRIKVFALLASLALLFVGNSTYGQFKYNPNALIPFDPAFKMGRLDNGIRYIIRSNPADKGKASFYALFKVGSIQEEPDEYGAAHFVEHLYAIYPDSDNQWKRYTQSIGLKFGSDISAATSEERTQYALFKVPTQREQILDSALLMLKDIPFHRFFYEQVNGQRKIITEEWRQRSIDINLPIKILHGVLGDTAVINHIIADRLKQFHDKWYRPDNLTIIAIGDFNAPKMEARIKQIFSSLPKAEGEKLCSNDQLPDNKEPIITITQTDSEESSTEICYKHNTVPYTQKRLREELTDQLISEMFSQRIKEAAENQTFPLTLNWAEYGNSYLHLFQYDSYEINCQTSENIGKAISFVLTEKERIEKYGFTTQELIQVKKGMLQNYQIRQPGNNQLPYSEYYIKCLYYILNGRIYPSDNYSCRFVQSVVPSITLQEINNRFKEYTAGIPPMVNIEVARGRSLPTTEEIKTLLTTTRTVRPYVPSAPVTSLEDKTIHPGHIVKETHNKEMGTTEWTLSNGMKVVIKPTGFNPNEIVFKGIRKEDLTLKSEYAYLSIYGKEFYKEMSFGNYSGSKIDQFTKAKKLSVNKEFYNFSGNTPPQELKTCLQLIRLQYEKQHWDEAAFNNRIKQIEKEMNNSSSTRTFWDTISSYTGSKCLPPRFISMNQLKQIHQEIYGDPSKYTFIFTGNIISEKAKPFVERYLASIPADTIQRQEPVNTYFYTTRNIPQFTPKDQAEIYHEFKYPLYNHGASIGLWCKGSVNNTPLQNSSYEELTSTLLGPYVTDLIREKEHATYQIFVLSTIDRSDQSITMGFIFETDPKTAKEINNKTKDIFKHFLKEKPDEKILESQKRSIINNRLRNLKSNAWWVNRALYEYYINGENIIPTYLSSIQNITPEDEIKFTNNLRTHGYLINIVMLPE